MEYSFNALFVLAKEVSAVDTVGVQDWRRLRREDNLIVSLKLLWTAAISNLEAFHA